MNGVGITYLWTKKTFPPFIRLEGKRGDYEVYVPERTCHNISDDPCWYECSSCKCTCSIDYLGGGLGSPNYCPSCGARVEVAE